MLKNRVGFLICTDNCLLDNLCVLLALERAASKADTIRNKWKNKRKSRMTTHSESESKPEVKEEHIGVDEVDKTQPDVTTDQVEDTTSFHL